MDLQKIIFPATNSTTLFAPHFFVLDKFPGVIFGSGQRDGGRGCLLVAEYWAKSRTVGFSPRPALRQSRRASVGVLLEDPRRACRMWRKAVRGVLFMSIAEPGKSDWRARDKQSV